MHRMVLVGLLPLIWCLYAEANAKFCQIATGFDGAPIDYQLKPGDASHVYIATKDGTVVSCTLNYDDCYEILRFPTEGITTEGERGFLSFAFHPNPISTYFFSLFTDENGDTQVSRFTLPSRGNNAWFSKENILGPIPQPYSNHNGGTVAFGPDGYLYIGQGDGGSGGDPDGNGQDSATRLGAILRIDVDSAPFSIPSGGYPGGEETVYSIGWRNPWRMSFDPVTGWLWVGDVGQNAWEEISIVDTSAAQPLNYGWNCYEGNNLFSGGDCANPGPPYIGAVFQYPHAGGGASVTGGRVYHGSRVSAHIDDYIFADYVTRNVYFLNVTGADPTALSITNTLMSAVPNFKIASFGANHDDELIAVSLNDDLWEMYPDGTDCGIVTLVTVNVDSLESPTCNDLCGNAALRLQHYILV